MSASAELAELLAITPPGDALPSDADSMWANWLAPLANELGLVRAQGAQLLVEVNPGEAENLLADYERVLGPDPYGRDTGNLTIAQRQALALSRWTGKYGVRPADFIALAATFGVTITIREYVLTKTNCFAGVQCVNHPNEYSWLVNLPTTNLVRAYANQASAGDLVSSFEAINVQGVIAARAPAHTTPVFSYA